MWIPFWRIDDEYYHHFNWWLLSMPGYPEEDFWAICTPDEDVIHKIPENNETERNENRRVEIQTVAN